MTIQLALLRGINVGGRTQVAMADLRELLSQLGFRDVRSLLRSGNLAFQSDPRTGAQLERLLEAEAEWKAVVAHNPFRKEARSDPGHLVVVFLKEAPDDGKVDALRAAITGREVVLTKCRQAYIVYPDGIGRSRLTNTLIEKKLGTRGTGPNWNTVLKVGALADP